MRTRFFATVLTAFCLATLWGCGSNMDSGGDQTGPGTTVSDAQSVKESSCTVCHTTIVAEGWDASPHNTTSAGCQGCHGGGQYHYGNGPIPYPAPTLADQCTQCHTAAGVVTRHSGDLTETSYQDTPTTPTVEGYVMTKASPDGCQDCHGKIPHGSLVEIEINRGWANSGHAGKIASASPDTGTVWGHYDWDASSRSSCQRCHTATGAKNLLDAKAAGTTYNAANNDFSHLEGWTATTSSKQNELLYCWGCHKDVNTGELRNPGAITEIYAAATTGAPETKVTYPDADKSNVCMGCHLGREIGENIKNDTDTDGVRSFVNSHYLAAGGMVFAKSGYEYAGQTYSKTFSGHAAVGSSDGNGPCVTCHMTSAESHKFEVVTKDANGAITAVATTACGTCHGNMNALWLEERKETFHTALDALKQALEAKGIYFYPAHPYFYKAAYVVGGTNTAFTDWASVYGLASWKDVMGAAFNYNLIEHDPGAYAHNRSYALKLVVDSIDFLADGVVDGAGVFTINSTSVDLMATAAGIEGVTLDAKHFGGTALVKAQYVAPDTTYDTDGGECSDCHADDETSANGVIIDEFAESGHGNVNGEAWWHYDWRASNRASCARCHTGTGYVAKLGNETNTSSIYQAGDANKAGEVLGCPTCHTDITTGAVREPAAYTETYNDGQTIAFPMVGKSNLCVRCHSGREAGSSIAADTDADGVRGFINSHYLSAGGTVFTTTGYEFAGLSYDNVAYYKHDKIGIADPDNRVASDAGPCVGCHMGTGTANHSWEVVSKDADGVITAINSNTCATCHIGDYTLTAAKLEEEVHHYHAALDALEAALKAKEIYFQARNPYFFVGPLSTDASFTNWAGVYGLSSYKDTMGAAFNYNLLHHDPGGYAHNRVYAKRLIFDSIDFIDNGVLDGTISVTGDAATYLGTTRP